MNKALPELLKPIKYKVIICSLSVRHDLITDLTEEEAFNYCDEHDWTYTDENEFVWHLNLTQQH